MQCAACGSENRKLANFCGDCGAPLGEICRHCDAALAPTAKFCDQCGAAVQATAPQRQGGDDALSLPGSVVADNTAERAANRRQMSVMCCDLVDSSILAHRLDPEDWRYALDSFHRISKHEVEAYTGYYAQYLGDGFMSYFGYPHANEDNAHRAVLSGLAIIREVGAFNSELEAKYGIRLRVRVGIDTGHVLVDKLVIGEPPNIASRVQSLAEPDTLVVTETTKRLLPPGAFDFQDLGVCNMKNIEAQRLFKVLGQKSARIAASERRAATQLIGRKQQLALLLENWERAKEGDGQAAIIGGEPGIGKSKLVEGLSARIADDVHMTFRFQGSPFHTNTMLHPVIESIQRAADIRPEDSDAEKRSKLDDFLVWMESSENCAGVVRRLMSVSSQGNLPIVPPKILQQQTLDALIDIAICQARKGPILFVFEDVHWFDSTTMELLKLLIPLIKNQCALVIMTTRSPFTRELQEKFFLTQISLNRLRPEEAAELIQQVAQGKALPEPVCRQILNKANGVPLYIEELTKMVLEVEAGLEAGAQSQVFAESDAAIPLTLRDPLTSRIDRVKGRDVLQLAATLGRTFSYELLSAISDIEPHRLNDELRELMSSELLCQRGRSPKDAVFEFKHTLIRDAAYSMLTKSDRRKIHHRIGRVLETQFPALSNAHPEVVAHHYTEAKDFERALNYCIAAGLQAAARSAHNDAIEYFNRGLAQIPMIDDPTKRRKLEQILQTALGNSLRAIRGWSVESVRNAYARALELGEEDGFDEHSVPAIFGLWTWNFVCSYLGEAKALADQLLKISERAQMPVFEVLAQQAQGFSMFGFGAFEEAHAALERSIRLCDDEAVPSYFELSAQDPRVHVRMYDAMVLWFLGHPDRALQRCGEARDLAEASENAFSRALAQTISLRVYQLCGDVASVSEQADAAVAFAEEHGFAHYLAMSSVLRGWAKAQRGNVEAGIAEIREAVEKERSTGARLYETYVLALLAEICIKSGDYRQASDLLDQAKARLRDGTSERFYEAEIHRLSGELCWSMHQNLGEAERCFRQALEVARKQKSRSLELRSCIALYDLHESGGEADRYGRELDSVYTSFSEGFSTADLLRAKKRLTAKRAFSH